MALQFKRTGTADFGFFIKALITGEPGSGKTLTSSTWPNPLYANAEGGLLSLRHLDIPVLDIKTSADLLDLKNALNHSDPAKREKELGFPVDTVVVDTVDEVGRILIKERLEATNKDALAIQDWGWYGEQLRDIIRAYRNLPLNVIFNCHIKTQTDEETGKMFLRPAIQGAVGDEIAGYVDLAVVLTSTVKTETVDNRPVKKLRRFIQTFPDTRQPWVKDRSGRLPMELDINFKDDFQRIYNLIFRDAASAPVTAAADAPQAPIPPAEAKEAVKAQPAAAAKKRVVAKAKAEPVSKVEEPEPEVEEALLPEQEPNEIQPPSEPEIPEPELEPVQESVPSPDTETKSDTSDTPADDLMACADCGGRIESKDQADLSFIRLKRRACKQCFRDARSRKAS